MKAIALPEVAKIVMGQSPPSSSYNTKGEGLPFFQGKADFGELYPTVRVFCTEPNKVAEAEDILISVRAPVGPTNISPTKCCIGRGLAAIRCSQAVELKYLLYFLRFHEPDLVRMGSGSTFDAISRDDLENIRVPLLPLPEQQRIAAILAKADRLRRLRHTARELGDTYLQSVFVEMFGDPVKNPKGWETLDFGKVLSIISGHGFKKDEYSNNGVRLFQIANVGFQETLWDTLAYLPLDCIKRYPKLVLKPGDLLMALNRPILGNRVKFTILKEEDCPAILYQRVGKFVIKSNRLHRDYLYGFMLTDYFYRELKVRLAGSDQPYINPTELVKMRFMLPPLTLQQQFAAVVHQFERLRARQREAERQAEHLFQTLLQRAFRGGL